MFLQLTSQIEICQQTQKLKSSLKTRKEKRYTQHSRLYRRANLNHDNTYLWNMGFLRPYYMKNNNFEFLPKRNCGFMALGGPGKPLQANSAHLGRKKIRKKSEFFFLLFFIIFFTGFFPLWLHVDIFVQKKTWKRIQSKNLNFFMIDVANKCTYNPI